MTPIQEIVSPHTATHAAIPRTTLEPPPVAGLPPIVEAARLSKRFGALQALADVSLKLRPGTFHALLGENGAGKSTLVKCIMGTYQADSGSVKVGEHAVELKNP